MIGSGGVLPPNELLSGVQSINLWPLDIPWGDGPLEFALYDEEGRLVDLVRTTGAGDERVHNHPWAPSHWSDFVGAAPRLAMSGAGAIARVGLADTDSGADWRAGFTRSMGLPNMPSTLVGNAGLGDSFDYRVNAGTRGGGFSIIVNAGPLRAGYHHSIFPSFLRTNGQGPFWGIGTDGLFNWIALNDTEPFGAPLDAEGAYRFDFPGQSLPAGITADIIAILQDPFGQIVARTKVLYYDS